MAGAYRLCNAITNIIEDNNLQARLNKHLSRIFAIYKRIHRLLGDKGIGGIIKEIEGRVL